jgi:hypothetical protein
MSETDTVLGLRNVAGISGRRAYSLRGNGLVSDFMADRIEFFGLGFLAHRACSGPPALAAF